jgi:imidazolonepropionase-like amidohydrolase
MMDKSHFDDLPSYETVVRPPRFTQRRRFRRWIRVVIIFSLLFLGYNLHLIAKQTSKTTSGLSTQKLREQHTQCASLRHRPVDPSGAREFNKRWVNGTKPALIRNATVWTGEPIAGVGYVWQKADVLLDRGLIIKVAPDLDHSNLPEGCQTYDARGRLLTAGIVDMHSHAGLGTFANLGDDTNELSGDITPYVRSLDGFDPLQPEIQWIKSGGVTTTLLLPGSGNNMGGEAFVLKLATGKDNGRLEFSQEDMLADPDKTWRYMKMACGENPKRVYGKIGRGPFSRLGEAWEFRHAFEQARKYVDSQDDWCRLANEIGAENMDSYLPSELQWESLGAVLRGQVRVNTHCYTVTDLEDYVRHTNEFKFEVYAFHHAHQSYLVPEVLKRAYGGRTPAAALFADNSTFTSR